MEALLDFFDQTDGQPPTSPRSGSSMQPLPASLPPEVRNVAEPWKCWTSLPLFVFTNGWEYHLLAGSHDNFYISPSPIGKNGC